MLTFVSRMTRPTLEMMVGSILDCVPKKRDQNVFCNISYTTWPILMKYGAPFPEQICCKWCKLFRLTWIMSLHYHVKLEKLIAHLLPLNWYRKKLQNLSHVNCVLQIRQIWIQLITTCGQYCCRWCIMQLVLWYKWNRQKFRFQSNVNGHDKLAVTIVLKYCHLEQASSRV